MLTLINGSGKPLGSNSYHFLRDFSKDYIYDLKKDKYEQIINNIKKSDSVVLAFPLYVDSPSNMILSFLEYLYNKKLLINKKIYTIINCGFLEGKQNLTALNIIKNFIKKEHSIHAGSILIGSGEIVGNKKYKSVTKKAYKKLNHFFYCVKQNKICDDIITSMDYMTKRLYVFLANKSWNKKCSMNNLKKEDIYLS